MFPSATAAEIYGRIKLCKRSSALFSWRTSGCTMEMRLRNADINGTAALELL